MTSDRFDLSATDILNTTLVREGLEATTVEELLRFAEEIDRRPIRQLLEDLPGLARLSQEKFDLVIRVIRSRISRQPFAIRERMQAMIRIFADGTGSREVAARLREISESPDEPIRG